MAMQLDKIQLNLLEQVADLHDVPAGAYNIRTNGTSAGRNTTANIDIVSKEDKDGIDIIIKPGTKKESIHIPVLLSESGIEEMVYNDFHIGEDADVVIVAGCGIHNGGDAASKHVEKHYGYGDGRGEKIMNPVTIIEMAENSYFEMETAQIRGVDSTNRKTVAKLADGATLIIGEKLLTHGSQQAITEFEVDLYGENSSAHVVSRSVAQDESYQEFISRVYGNNCCSGHTECDAIVMNNAKVAAIPEIKANHTEASLIHEAAIGKIAGEQLIKLMTLGLTEKEAEEQIISGFLK